MVSKVADLNVRTVVISVMDKTTTDRQMTIAVQQTTTVAHRMVVAVHIMVLALHNSRTKELHKAIEMKADSLNKLKRRKNET